MGYEGRDDKARQNSLSSQPACFYYSSHNIYLTVSSFIVAVIDHMCSYFDAKKTSCYFTVQQTYITSQKTLLKCQ